MEVLLLSTWMLSLATATYVALSKPKVLPAAYDPDSDGLSEGLRFPLSLLFSRINRSEWSKNQAMDPLAVLIASPNCSSCKPLLKDLGALMREQPHWRFVLLLHTPPVPVETLIAEYGWTFPVLDYAKDLERALDTHFLPTLYLVEPDGRVAMKAIPHSSQELAALLA